MNSVVVDGMAEAQFFFILPPNCHMPDDNRAVQKERSKITVAKFRPTNMA
jgi:hypothetical protein